MFTTFIIFYLLAASLARTCISAAKTTIPGTPTLNGIYLKKAYRYRYIKHIQYKVKGNHLSNCSNKNYNDCIDNNNIIQR